MIMVLLALDIVLTIWEAAIPDENKSAALRPETPAHENPLIVVSG